MGSFVACKRRCGYLLLSSFSLLCCQLCICKPGAMCHSTVINTRGGHSLETGSAVKPAYSTRLAGRSPLTAHPQVSSHGCAHAPTKGRQASKQGQHSGRSTN